MERDDRQKMHEWIQRIILDSTSKHSSPKNISSLEENGPKKSRSGSNVPGGPVGKREGTQTSPASNLMDAHRDILNLEGDFQVFLS